MRALENCPDCGSSELIDQKRPLILQQVELPEIKAIVTQFDCLKYSCTGCGKTSFADLPEGVPYSSFGPKLMALIASLTGVFHLAKRDAIQLIQDLYGVAISEGSIINVEERVANSLNPSYEKIHQHVMTSSMAKHFDEPSWRDQGKNQWAWVASTSNATCFKIDPSRSKEAFLKFAENLSKAPVVTDRYSDRYSAYTGIETPHQQQFPLEKSNK